MERHFVVECDSAMSTVFVYEVTKEYTSEGAVYHREAERGQLFNEFPGPKLYGKLDLLLITADRIKDAKPIAPEPQELLQPKEQ